MIEGWLPPSLRLTGSAELQLALLPALRHPRPSQAAEQEAGVVPLPSDVVTLASNWDEEFREASKLRVRPASPRAGPIGTVSLRELETLLSASAAEGSLEIVAVVEAVPGLAPGVYRRSPGGTGLLPGRTIDPRRFHADTGAGATLPAAAPPEADRPGTRPAVTLAVLADFARLLAIHGLRGYREALLGAGRVAQEVSAIGAGLGLVVRHWGDFADDAADRHLGLDGRDRGCLYLLGVFRRIEGV